MLTMSVYRCREAGVRNLKKQLEKIYRKGALKLVQMGVEPPKPAEQAQQQEAAAGGGQQQAQQASVPCWAEESGVGWTRVWCGVVCPCSPQHAGCFSRVSGGCACPYPQQAQQQRVQLAPRGNINRQATHVVPDMTLTCLVGPTQRQN